MRSCRRKALGCKLLLSSDLRTLRCPRTRLRTRCCIPGSDKDLVLRTGNFVKAVARVELRSGLTFTTQEMSTLRFVFHVTDITTAPEEHAEKDTIQNVSAAKSRTVRAEYASGLSMHSATAVLVVSTAGMRHVGAVDLAPQRKRGGTGNDIPDVCRLSGEPSHWGIRR